jgi:hypothetical protein
VTWYTLTLKVTSGADHLQTTDKNMNCGPTWGNCTWQYPAGSSVTVQPLPYGNSATTTLDGVVCNSSGGFPCTVTMNAAHTIAQTSGDYKWIHYSIPSSVSGGPTISASGYTVTSTTSTTEELVRASSQMINGPSGAGGNYWEITVNTASNSQNVGGIGIIDSTPGQVPANNGYLGLNSNGIGFGYDSSDQFWKSWTLGSYAPAVAGAPPSGFILSAGNVYMFAFDANSGKLWIGQNGTWWFGGNPQSGANPSITGLPPSLYAAAVLYGSSGSGPMAITLNYGASTALNYWPPFGF